MASFPVAYSLMAQHEGGYVDDPDDQGGETIGGIARRFNPSWQGWTLIDAWKADAGAPRPFVLNPRQYAVIDPLVVDFYRREYWDRLRGTDLASQAIADELLEASVLLGIDRGVRILQRALNLANDRAQRWPDIAIDGKAGDETIDAVRAATRTRRDHFVVTLQNIQQGAHFIQRYEARPINEKFIGWLNRVTWSREGKR